MSVNAKIELYRGYAKLEPVGNDDCVLLVFPLNEAASYKIGSSLDSDLLLPLSEENIPVPQATLYVDKDGKVSLINTGDQWSLGESLKVAGTILLTGEKCNLTEKTAIEFGPYSYSFQFSDTPTARYLKSLFDTVKCTICSEILEEPQSLSCSHTFCNRCIAQLVDSALTIEHEHEDRGEAVANRDNPTITCPTCNVKLHVSTLSDPKQFKALAEVTKTIRELNDDRAFCVQCSNKRILMHGSDYAYCETCKLVLCPLCAMDGHREHDLGSNYVKALRNGKEFTLKCSTTRKEWMEIAKQIQRVINLKVKRAIKSAGTCVDMLSIIERKIGEIAKKSNDTYAEIESLQTFIWDNRVDAKRLEFLRLIENRIQTILPEFNPLLVELNAKSEILLNPLKYIKNFNDPSQSSAIGENSLNSASSPTASPNSASSAMTVSSKS